MSHNLVDAFILARRYRNDGNTETLLHFVYQHRAAAAAHLIHHIQRKHHRNVKLHQLKGQIKIALDVRRVDDIDYPARLFVKDKAARNYLLARVR